MGGGKRLRPILCVSAYGACGGSRTEGAYDLGASLEMIHAYSLMHDDLPCMDDDAISAVPLFTYSSVSSMSIAPHIFQSV